MQLDYVLQAFNVYTDGFGKLGYVEKCSTPKIKKKSEDFRGGGMLAATKHVLGYEAFEFGFGLTAYDPQVIRLSGLFSKKGFPISFTSAFDGDRNAQHAAQLVCRGQFLEIDPGSWEAGKKAMLDVKGVLEALKLTMDGETLYDIDITANKYVIGGVDEYAWIGAAL